MTTTTTRRVTRMTQSSGTPDDSESESESDLNDWMVSDEAQAWSERVLEELVPKLQSSMLTVSIVPNGPADVKFAVELGMSIMLDKPIVLAIKPGVHVPEKLVQIADELVEIDLSDETTTRKTSKRVSEAIKRIVDRERERARARNDDG